LTFGQRRRLWSNLIAGQETGGPFRSDAIHKITLACLPVRLEQVFNFSAQRVVRPTLSGDELWTRFAIEQYG
jgi:hypothetical protein